MIEPRKRSLLACSTACPGIIIIGGMPNPRDSDGRTHHVGSRPPFISHFSFLLHVDPLGLTLQQSLLQHHSNLLNKKWCRHSVFSFDSLQILTL